MRVVRLAGGVSQKDARPSGPASGRTKSYSGELQVGCSRLSTHPACVSIYLFIYLSICVSICVI